MNEICLFQSHKIAVFYLLSLRLNHNCIRLQFLFYSIFFIFFMPLSDKGSGGHIAFCRDVTCFGHICNQSFILGY